MTSTALRDRVVSTCMAVPLLLYALQYRSTKLGLLGLLTVKAASEYYRCIQSRYPTLHTLLACLTPGLCYTLGHSAILPSTLLTLLLCSILALYDPQTPLPQEILGHVYIDTLLAHGVSVHELYPGHGSLALLYVISVTIVGENGGYFGGRGLGTHHPVPLVSPHKTTQGFLVGLMLSCATSSVFHVWVFSYYGYPTVSPGQSLVHGGVLGLAGILGDLFESLLKRTHGVKDMDTVLPGWGGVLDRLDGVLFTLPVYYYLH